MPPAALSQDRCVALAGREPCGRPVVAAFGQARPRGRRGIGLWPVGVARAGGSPRFALCADVAAPEAAVAPGTLRVAWHLPRGHAPEPVRVPRFRRRCAASLVWLGPVGRTSPLRTELAGRWAGLWTTPGNARKCVRERLESAPSLAIMSLPWASIPPPEQAGKRRCRPCARRWERSPASGWVSEAPPSWRTPMTSMRTRASSPTWIAPCGCRNPTSAGTTDREAIRR